MELGILSFCCLAVIAEHNFYHALLKFVVVYHDIVFATHLDREVILGLGPLVIWGNFKESYTMKLLSHSKTTKLLHVARL